MDYSSVRPLISEIARIIEIYFFFNNTAVGRVLMTGSRVSFNSEYLKGDFPKREGLKWFNFQWFLLKLLQSHLRLNK